MSTKPASGPCYVLRITLQEVAPPVWRRVVISGDRTLTRLNDVIQAAMGWTHSHLHRFEGEDGRAWSDPAFELDDCLDQRRARVKDVLPGVGSRLRFVYDLGDGWSHDVLLEQIATGYTGREPLCFDGERACPPEDVGGVGGYEDFLEAIADPGHERHRELRGWYAGTNLEGQAEFDPDELPLERINQQLARPPRARRSAR